MRMALCGHIATILCMNVELEGMSLLTRALVFSFHSHFANGAEMQGMLRAACCYTVSSTLQSLGLTTG